MTNESEPYVAAFWGPRTASFGESVTQVQTFLEGLRKIHPIFNTWYMLGDRMNAEKPVGDRLENLRSLILERGWDKEAPKHWFTHLDDQGRPTAESVIDVGWGFDLVTEPEVQRTSEYVLASFGLGKNMPRIPNRVRLVFDETSPLLDPTVADQILRYIIEFWNPDRAFVTDAPFRNAVRGPEQLGWLNYRADSRFSEYLPDEVPREPFNGGILFRIGDGHPLADNDIAEVQVGTNIQQAISAKR